MTGPSFSPYACRRTLSGRCTRGSGLGVGDAVLAGRGRVPGNDLGCLQSLLRGDLREQMTHLPDVVPGGQPTRRAVAAQPLDHLVGHLAAVRGLALAVVRPRARREEDEDEHDVDPGG